MAVYLVCPSWKYILKEKKSGTGKTGPKAEKSIIN